MKVALTLVVRDEADLVDANLAFHLSVGVDLVIALDNGSRDGTTEVLEAYARSGRLHLIREPGAHLRRSGSQTALARLAASTFGADWVIPCDADQFYWPRRATLKEILAAVPEPNGVVTAVRRVFVPRPEGEPFFAERMTVRFAALAPVNDPASPFRPQSNVVHRAHGRVVVATGNRGVSGASLVPVPGWHPIEVLHFPIRSAEQCARKYVAAHPDWLANAVRARAVSAYRQGRVGDYYGALVVDDERLERGLADGSLVIDTRLRDALRALGAGWGVGARPLRPANDLELPRPSPAEDAAHAAEAAVVAEADAVRVRRRLDELELRLAGIEPRGGGRCCRAWSRRLRRLALAPAGHGGGRE